MLSLLDMKSNIAFSRIPSSDFRTVDDIKDWIRDKIQTQMRIKCKLNRTHSRLEYMKRNHVNRITRKLDDSAVNSTHVSPAYSDKKLKNRMILQARAQKMVDDIRGNCITSKSYE